PHTEEVLVVFHREAVRLARHIVAAGAQNGARFIHGAVEGGAHSGRFAGDADAGVVTVLAQPGGDGNNNVVVSALPQGFTFLFAHADHQVGFAVHANFAVDGVNAGQKVLHNIVADNGHSGAAFQIVFIEHAAFDQVEVHDWRHRRGEPAHPGVCARLLSIAHVAVSVEGGSAHIGAPLAVLEHSAVVLQGQVLAFVLFQVLVNVGDHAAGFAHDKDVRAQAEDTLGHVAVDAAHEGDHGDYRRHPDHHPQQGEHGAQFVGPQGQQGDAHGLGGIHG